MAADGSVIIDTALDNSGVETGARDVEKRIGALTSTVNRIGNSLSKTFSGLFKGIGAAAQQSTSGVTDTARQATQAQAAAAKASAEYDKQLSSLQKQIDAAKGKLSDYYEALDRIHQFTDEALQYAATDADAGNVLDTEQEQIAALNEKYADKLSVLQELEAEYTRVAEARDAALQPPAADADGVDGQTAADGIRAVGGAEDSAASKTTRFSSMLASLGRVMSTVANHALNLCKRLGQMGFNTVTKGIKKGISALKSFTAQTGKTTLTTNGLVHSLTSLKRLMITRVKRMFISSIFNNVKEGLTALEGYSSKFKKVMDSLRGSAKAAAGNISVAISGLVSAIAPVLQYLISLLNTVLTLINQVFALLGGRGTYTVAKNGTGGMAKAASAGGNAVRNNASMLAKAPLAAGGMANPSSETGLMAKAAPSMGLMAKASSNSSRGSNAAASGAGGNKAKVKEANEIAEAMEKATAATKGLNNELYDYDELTHKEKKNDASSNVKDYAKAANDAADAQKGFNAELYGYDELTRQNKQDGGGGGGGGGGAGIAFEEEPIDLPKSVVDWIERLKKAWQDGDWHGVGKVVAEGLNKAMEVVDNWINTKFRPIAVEWASRTAQILNGTIDGLDWKRIGKTVADGINAVFDAANTFLSTVNWLTLGRRISDAVKSWFDNVEWGLVGKTFANKWNALIRTIRGFVTNAGMWKSIGKSIGQFVKSWFSTIDVGSIAGALIGIFNGVTASITAFLSQNPFKGVATKIYSAINRVLHEVDWAALGKSLGDLFMEVLGVLLDVVNNIDWKQVGVAIGELLSGIDWGSVFTQVGEAIWTAFSGMLQGLLSTSGGRIFTALFLGFKGLTAVPKMLAPLLSNAGKGIVSALGNGVITAAAGIGTYFVAMKDALTNGLNWLNGVMIPIGSTLGGAGVGAIIGALGGPIGSGIGALIGLAIGLVTDGIIAIREHWTEISAWFTEQWTAFSGWISGVWNNLATFAATAWNTISTAIITAFDSAVNWVKTAATDVGNWLSTTWANISTWTSTAWASITTTISTAFTNAKNWVVTIANNIGTQLSTTWNAIKTTATTVWNGIKTSVTTAFDNLKTALTTAMSALQTAFSTAWTSVKTFAVNTWNGIKTSVTTTFNNLTTALTTAMNALQTALSTAWTSVKTFAVNTWNGIKTSVTTTFNNLKTSLTTAAEALQTTFSTTWTSIKTFAVNTWNGIKTSVTTAFNSLKTALTTAAEALKTALSTAWTSIKTTATTTWNAIKTGVTTAFNNTKTAIVNAVTSLKSSLSSAWNSIKTTAANAWNSVKQTATNAWTSLSQTVSSKWQALKDALGLLDFTSIGKNLVEGLKNGVGGAWDSLVSKAKSLAQGLVSKFKGWFGIASPSKVFAEIGTFLDAGMEKGLTDGEGKLLHTAGNIAEAVTNGMTPDSPKVTLTAEGIVGSMQAVISGLSSIAATFQTIAETLTSMGGLQVPQIAAGTVVPYKTKVDGNTSSAEDESDAVEDHLSGIYRALQTLIELIRANGQNNSTVKVMVDGREIFNVVVKENNRAIRRTGTSPIRV